MTSPSATTGVEVSINGPSPGVDQIRAPVSASRAFIVPVPSPTYTTPPATAGAATMYDGKVVCQIRLPEKASRATTLPAPSAAYTMPAQYAGPW